MNIPHELQSKAYFANEKQKDIEVNTLFERNDGFDTKHITNLSNLKPNIRLIDIEKDGVSIEEIDSINVPVCKYKTQVTIHGTFDQGRVGYCAATGYKSIVQNKNKSVGIRWIAIDGLKKKTVSRAVRLDSDCKWRFSQNSTGTELLIVKGINEIPELQSIAKAIPKDMFYGSVYIFRAPMYGIAWLCVEISAIKNLWGFIGHFTKVKSAFEFNIMEERKLHDDELQAQVYKIQREQEKENRRIEIEERKKAIAEKYGLNGVDQISTGHYIRVSKNRYTGTISYSHCQVLKAFGKLIVKTEKYATITEAIVAQKKEIKITNKGHELNGFEMFFKAA